MDSVCKLSGTTLSIFKEISLLCSQSSSNEIQISQKELSERLGWCRATINRHIQSLEKLGVLTVKRGPVNSRVPNIYCVTGSYTSVCSEKIQIRSEKIEESIKQTKSHMELHSISFPGIAPNVIDSLIDSFGIDRVRAIKRYTMAQHNLKSPAGFFIRACQGTVKVDIELEKKDYTSGKYAAFITR